MADKENSVRLTRAQAKKRPAAASLQALPNASKRKRTALAELPISANLPQNLNLTSEPKTRLSKKKAMAAAVVPVALPSLTPASVSDEVAHSDLDDPQMCPLYAKDIHQYLRDMEVREPSSFNFDVRLDVGFA